MASTFDDTVFDFDLNFLRQTANNTVVPSKIEKQRKAILIVKKKTIVTDSLIRKYYTKKELLDQAEKNLLVSNEECKNICIDYKSTLEKCSKLEQDTQYFEKTKQELQEKIITLENRFDGIQSHSKQLQLLVNENETRIESMKIENQLDKANVRDCEKKVSSLKKEKHTLLDHIYMIKDVLLGKKKLSKKVKLLLENYKKSSQDEVSEDSCSEEDNSQDGTDVLDDPMSPCTDKEEYMEENDKRDNYSTSQAPTKHDSLLIITQKDSVTTRLKKDEIDRDSDCSNEVVSVDTGRGSSLEFSDSDKCFHSPDYFLNDSPLNAEITSKDIKLTETATSPITVSRVAHAATSPVIFEPIDLPIIIVTEDCDSTPVFDKTNVPKITIDKGVSPIKSILEIDNSTNDYSCNTKKTSKEIVTSPMKFSNETSSNKENYGCGKTLQEKECLEINNSDNLVDDNSNDGEIEMILNKMRLTHELITPIPSTPSKSQSCVTNTSVLTHELITDIPSTLSKSRTAEKSCISRTSVTQDASHTGSSQFVCLDAAKIREENKMLHSNIAGLTKEVQSIKDLLMNQLFNNKNSNNKNVAVNQLCNNEGFKTSHEHYNDDCLASSEINVTNDNEDNCSTGDGSDIVRLEDPMLMPPQNEDLSIDNDNESENYILYMETANTSLNTAQLLQFEEETEQEHTSIIGNIYEPLEAPINNKDSLSEKPKRLVTANKLSRLAKLRKKLVPKNKIKSVNTPPLKKPRFKPKQFLPSKKKKVKDSDSAASLNNKEIYDKAVKIMAAIKSKQPEMDKIDNITDLNSKKINVPFIDKSDNVRFTSPKKNNVPVIYKINNVTDENPRKNNVVSNTTRLPDKKKKIVKDSDSAASLNNKEIYDKAVKITAAVKSKQPVTDKINKVTNLNSEKINVPCIDKCDNVRFLSPEKNNVPDIDKSNNVTDANPKKNDLVSDTAYLPDASECRRTVESLDQRGAVNSISSRRQPPASPSASPKNSVTTRSRVLNGRSKHVVHDKKQDVVLPIHSDLIQLSKPGDNNNNLKENEVTVARNENTSPSANKKTLKRPSVEKPEVEHKRILRSSSGNTKTDTPNKETTAASAKDVEISDHNISKQTLTTNHVMEKIDNHGIVNYSDLNMFTEDASPVIETLVTQKQECHEKASIIQKAHESILCGMIDKYGITSNKVKNSSKMSETTINNVSKIIEDGIAHIIELPPNEANQGMNKFADDLCNLNLKHFLAGLMNYLKQPERKNELFSKVSTPLAPPMTKSEQVLLYVVNHLRERWPDVDVVNCILSSIEYTLFKLNHTPEFMAIESMSHFYAVLCRYIQSKSRLRLFILDAMYCIQFKSVPLIKQCLDVWMHVLPLAHMGIAKSPVVTCLVYLLHFYKCEDKYNRVQEIKNILNRKYSYQITEWNQAKILDMFKNAIKELRDIAIEKKMLRIALIILAKRHGPKWCESNIIKNMLLPMIEKADMPERVKLFCVSMLGPLLKPYPVDMKVHCEIVMNQLVDMLENNPSQQMEEAILKSLIFMSKHNQNRVVQVLLSRNNKQISPEMEDILRNYVREKPLRVWKTIFSRISLVR